jgi:LmbE family N-acetylglucosaminyl deacetylase/AmiR/NasT family two-component response regulator
MDDSRPAAPRGRILLIDDDRVFGMWATKVLQARGFEIQHTLDPVAGLKQVEAEPWDLVITDVEMPRMTGLEFLERVRGLEPSLPVAVVTAHPSVERAVTTMRQAGTEFIQKPITPDDFVARITALITARGPARRAAAESVLAVGAHPGDVEIGAAGTLLAHIAAGVAVTILTLSPGAPDAAGMGGGGEPEGAALVIGTRVGLDDLGGPSACEGDAAVAAIERLIAQVQPTVIYTHSVHDAQQDHRNTHAAVVAAAWKIGRVYCFQSPSATADFRPTYFVAIDGHIDGKLSAARAFAFQPEVRDYLEPDLVTSTARYWSRYCEAQLAEAFEVVRDRAAAGAAAGAQDTARATP